MYSQSEGFFLSEMRVISICLASFVVVKDIRHDLEDASLPLWLEWQILRTGKTDLRIKMVKLKGGCPIYFSSHFF
jgi:hypothetical protein